VTVVRAVSQAVLQACGVIWLSRTLRKHTAPKGCVGPHQCNSRLHMPPTLQHCAWLCVQGSQSQAPTPAFSSGDQAQVQHPSCNVV
jgi:hypothetical protein